MPDLSVAVQAWSSLALVAVVLWMACVEYGRLRKGVGQ